MSKLSLSLSLSGQVVFITGASSGIGAALAREFARQGADIALAARRVERLREVAVEVEAIGRRALVLSCDVTKDGDLEHALEETNQTLGNISVVVANAGFLMGERFEELTIDDYRRQFETNVFGVLRTVKAALEDLKKTKGRLIIIGSTASYIAGERGSAYAMSKFAVRAFADSLRKELRKYSVSVTLINPGAIDTKNELKGFFNMSSEQAAKRIVKAAFKRKKEVILTLRGKLAVFIQKHFSGWGGDIEKGFSYYIFRKKKG